ncbi:unnamed protein product [Boreogadus saida]
MPPALGLWSPGPPPPHTDRMGGGRLGVGEEQGDELWWDDVRAGPEQTGGDLQPEYHRVQRVLSPPH